MELLRVLLVEDDVVDQQAFLRYVEKTYLPYVTQVISSVEEAKCLLRAGKFDAVIVDHRLSDGTAFDVLKVVRNETVVIVMTGRGDEETVVRAMQSGAADYLMKDAELHYLSLLPLTLDNAIARKRTEMAFHESEKRYRNLIENANDAIVSFTVVGIVTSVNRGFERMLGWSREEVLGRHYRQFVPPVSVGFGEAQIRRFLAGERVPSLFETEFLSKDGRIIPVEVRTQVIRNQARDVIGFQGVYRDISARKALEQQRTEFLAMLTHDIKNPLTVLIGYTDFLLQTLRGREARDIEELVVRLRNGAQGIHQLITNCLQLSTIEAGHVTLVKKPLSVNLLLQRLQHQYEPEATQHQIHLAFRLAESLPLIAGDSEALERVFVNLLYNALKFTPSLGEIEIATVALAPHVIITVTDTGPGLKEDEIPRLFQKYQYADKGSSKGGTGLGLYIAKSFVDAHGGHITAHNTAAGGSCFSVFLPVSAESMTVSIARLDNGSAYIGA